MILHTFIFEAFWFYWYLKGTCLFIHPTTWSRQVLRRRRSTNMSAPRLEESTSSQHASVWHPQITNSHYSMMSQKSRVCKVYHVCHEMCHVSCKHTLQDGGNGDMHINWICCWTSWIHPLLKPPDCSFPFRSAIFLPASNLAKPVSIVVHYRAPSPPSASFLSWASRWTPATSLELPLRKPWNNVWSLLTSLSSPHPQHAHTHSM